MWDQEPSSEALERGALGQGTVGQPLTSSPQCPHQFSGGTGYLPPKTTEAKQNFGTGMRGESALTLAAAPGTKMPSGP